MKKILLFFLIIVSLNSYARESYDYTQSAKGILMGGAYSTLADDEYSLFYNPALLARHEAFSFYPLNPSISAINPLGGAIDADDLDGDVEDIADAIMGKPIHLGFNYAPGFKMGKFGLSAIVNQRTNFTLRNKANPLLDIDYVYDKGFILGYGHVLSGRYSPKSGGEQLSFGMSVKYINREELRGNYSIFSPALYDAIEAGEISDILDELGVVKSSGWGLDAGLDYIKRVANTEISFGISLIDLYTKLQANESGEVVGETNTKVNLSSSWKTMMAADIGFVLSGELRDIAKVGDYTKKYRIGAEVRLTPALSFYGGINSGQYSYGLGLNLGLLKLQTGFYTVDTGVVAGQEISQRAIIYLSLLNFKFDG